MAKVYLHKECIKILSKYFSEGHKFWCYFDKYVGEYLKAVSLEKERHKNVIRVYDKDEESCILIGKSAVAKVVIAALGFLNDNEDMIIQLEKSQNYYAMAYQLLDDLRDWKKDLACGQYTSFLTNILCVFFNGKLATEEQIKQVLFDSKVYENTINRIIEYCDASLLYSSNSISWVKLVKMLQYRVSFLLDDIRRIKNDKENVYESFQNYYLTKKSIIETLKRQQKNSFPEMNHFMVFKKEDGFSCDNEVQCGLLFQRLFFNNFLRENCSKKGVDEFADLLNAEWHKFNNSKEKIIGERFKYFSDLPELSSDIDTLSEAIKIYSAYDNKSKELEEYIDYAINCTWHEEGYFDTWIIDKESNSKLEIKRRNVAKFKWGNNYDIEVNLNFIYALSNYNFKKYKSYIKKCVNWLIPKFSEKIEIESSWYSLENYIYYLISKNKMLFIEQEEILKDIVIRLKNKVNKDGSFGAEKSVLETAFMILILRELSEYGDKKELIEIIENAKQYLKSKCLKGGYWKSEPFIKMNLKRVEGNNKYLYYGSATLTTVCCFAALI